ncbi:hypothetical protein B0H34DRAFT_362767 [Crassisporium funariophilum]|nr:hypothetical protein B0H34DRAFT_362767 [Crassisporium funariophilum]
MTSGERSQDSISQVTSSATQIDNESLQEQVRYLSEKSAMLEEKLEDARAALAKDERSYTSRIEQLQHDDKQRKRELGTKTKEVEQLMKSEAFARNRVEEIEEALRESTVALETARGEVEVLRAELTNLDILVGDSSEGDISSRIVGFTKRATADRSRHEQEISRLEDLLRESHAEGNNRGSIDTLVALQQAVDTLKAQNSSLREQTVRSEKRLSELAQQLEDRTSEVEALRKKSNRDVPFSNGPQEKLTSPKFDSSTAREEVAGLK